MARRCCSKCYAFWPPPGSDPVHDLDKRCKDVRNLDEDIVRALRIQAAEHGRSAEAEHRELLRAVLTQGQAASSRDSAAARLEQFRRRTAGRGSATAEQLLDASRPAV